MLFIRPIVLTVQTVPPNWHEAAFSRLVYEDFTDMSVMTAILWAKWILVALSPRLAYLAKIHASIHLPNVCLALVTTFPRLVYFARVCEGMWGVCELYTHTQEPLVCVASVNESWELDKPVPDEQANNGFCLHTLTVECADKGTADCR
jgi:hypothetical protein